MSQFFLFIWLWCQCFCFNHAQSGWLEILIWLAHLLLCITHFITYLSFQLVLFLTPSFISLIQMATLQVRVYCFSKIIDALKWGCQTTRGSFWDILCGSWIWMTCFIIIDDVTFRRGFVFMSNVIVGNVIDWQLMFWCFFSGFGFILMVWVTSVSGLYITFATSAPKITLIFLGLFQLVTDV